VATDQFIVDSQLVTQSSQQFNQHHQKAEELIKVLDQTVNSIPWSGKASQMFKQTFQQQKQRLTLSSQNLKSVSDQLKTAADDYRQHEDQAAQAAQQTGG
jgi:WXG100 family type VII secretion target